MYEGERSPSPYTCAQVAHHTGKSYLERTVAAMLRHALWDFDLALTLRRHCTVELTHVALLIAPQRVRNEINGHHWNKVVDLHIWRSNRPSPLIRQYC